MGSGLSGNEPRLEGCDLANLSASNETVGKDEYRELLVKSASARLICGYIYTSAGEGESTQDLVFGGHNLIAENGILLAQVKKFSCETIYSDIDVERILSDRRRMGTFGKEPQAEYVKVSFRLKTEETVLDRKFAPLLCRGMRSSAAAAVRRFCPSSPMG